MSKSRYDSILGILWNIFMIGFGIILFFGGIAYFFRSFILNTALEGLSFERQILVVAATCVVILVAAALLITRRTKEKQSPAEEDKKE